MGDEVLYGFSITLFANVVTVHGHQSQLHQQFKGCLDYTLSIINLNLI